MKRACLPLVLGLSMAAAGPAAAQSVSVTVNGAPVSLSPPPLVREGRVFVPLRGVFEHLGASVVYENGAIAAQGDGHSISLHVGSPQANVDGQAKLLDVAPFIVGSSTYVPLRFVSQALGAQVDYDAANRQVALTEANAAPNERITPVPSARRGAPRPAAPAPTAAPTAFNTLRLVDLSPSAGTDVRASRPAIGGRFSQPVQVDAVHIALDGRDVSSTTYMNPRQFAFTPPYDLPAEQHTVRVTGRAEDGSRFDRSWRFRTGSGVAANFIRELRPADGSAVGASFRVAGVTDPRAKVRIVAAASTTLEGIIKLQSDTYTTDVTANDEGRFEAEVPLQNVQGGTVTLQVSSVSPEGQAVSTRETLRVR